MTLNLNIHKCEVILTNFWEPEKNPPVAKLRSYTGETLVQF